MIRSACVGLAFAALMLAPQAEAQELRVGGGIGLPMQPSAFTDYWGLGFHGGAELGGAVGKKKTTSIGVAAYHHRFPLDSDAYVEGLRARGVLGNESYSLEGGTFILTEVFAVMHNELGSGSVRPYLVSGLGLGFVDASKLVLTIGDVTREVSVTGETDFMATLGLGVRAPVGPISVFAQARIALVFTEGDDTMLAPITAGVVF